MLNKIKDAFTYFLNKRKKINIRRKKASLNSYPAQEIRIILNLNRPVLINCSGFYKGYNKTLYYKPADSLFVKSFHTKVKASSRIGPHNNDVFSVVIGSLLGDSYANAKSLEGTRFCYRQSIVHKDYLF